MNDLQKKLDEEKSLRIALEKTNEELLDKLQKEQKKNEELSSRNKNVITVDPQKWTEIQTKLSQIDQIEDEKKRLWLKLDETTKRLDNKILCICLLERKIKDLEEKENNYLSEEVEGFFVCYACGKNSEVETELGSIIGRGKSKLFVCAICMKDSYANVSELKNKLLPNPQ